MGDDQRRPTRTPTGLSPSMVPLSNGLRLDADFLTPPHDDSRTKNNPTTPHTQPLSGITRARFSLIRFRSPLLSESLLFSLPTGTEMFHFPAFPPHTLYIQVQVTGHNSSQVSPFGHPRINARLPTPQGLSQAPTSFIGSRCQGIHRVPFEACHSQILNKNNKDTLTYKITTPHTDPDTHPNPHQTLHEGETGARRAASSARQMLASTIQISNTTKTTRKPAHQGRDAKKLPEEPPPPTPRPPGTITPGTPRAGRDASDTQQRALPPSTTPTAPRTGHHRAAARGISRRPLVSTTMRKPDTRRPTGVRAP